MDFYTHQIFWQENGDAFIHEYTAGKTSFIQHLLPKDALALPAPKFFELLEKRLGTDVLHKALDPNNTIPSPIDEHQNADWLTSTNMVGINVRTIGDFWNVIKYATTLSDQQDSIHLLPIWEPGVVSSLYGIASWMINPEFFSQELYERHPHLDTVERQLKVVVNLLHAMGKKVGMDVIPHTDRYSEIVLTNPHYFEWLRREDLQIVDHSADLHLEVQAVIMDFLETYGAVNDAKYPLDKKLFFSSNYGENARRKVLFGENRDYGGRNHRRTQLMDFLFRGGYEPVPATMGPPYRGLAVIDNPNQQADGAGRIWRDYEITKPEQFSRVFGPLTRFKLYERKENNQYWEVDFSQPRKEVWDYICQKYYDVQYQFGFDFMRGDMAHVQMRPAGVPQKADRYYDPLRAIRNHIQQQKPYFGYFAETFLAPPNTMLYGDEVDHLELAMADSTLGDLQSMVVGSQRFMHAFRWYLDILHQRSVAPNFTIMTADKDDPRFDEYYLKGNEIRFFMGLFMTDMPSYVGLGFECRDPHPEAAPNEHYTKLYVFQIESGAKATFGPYQFGQNTALFHRLNAIKNQADELLPNIKNKSLQWILTPDATANQKLIAWTHDENPEYIFVVNLDVENAYTNAKIPSKFITANALTICFSTHNGVIANANAVTVNAPFIQLPTINAAEGIILKMS